MPEVLSALWSALKKKAHRISDEVEMKDSIISSEVLVSRYEALRERTLGSNDNFYESSPLDTLMRQGMLVWMREVQSRPINENKMENPLLTRARDNNCIKQHAKTGSIIADMMTLNSKNSQFKEQYI